MHSYETHGASPGNNRVVFLCSSRHTIVGCEFGKIRTGEDLRKMAVSIVGQLAPRIVTIKIGRLTVLLQRDRDERPRPDKVLGRLRYRLLPGQKNSENQR